MNLSCNVYNILHVTANILSNNRFHFCVTPRFVLFVIDYVNAVKQVFPHNSHSADFRSCHVCACVRLFVQKCVCVCHVIACNFAFPCIGISAYACSVCWPGTLRRHVVPVHA